MNIISFSFTKLHGHRSPSFNLKSVKRDFSIDISDIVEEKVPFSAKGSAVKASFKYEVAYNDAAKKDGSMGQVSIEGNVAIMMTDEESKEVLKSWKGKKLPVNIHEFIVNFILRKCSAKAMELQDAINLPSHIPIPRAKIGTA
jgi:hypothetical protein